jgi:hypothetical protein
MFKDINWWTLGLWALLGYTFGMSYFYFANDFVYSLLDAVGVWGISIIGRFQIMRQLEIDFGGK